MNTLYWHDYETFGADPRRDRPAQFAGIRTDENLEIVGEPLVLYCRPANDMLPQPEACLVTGITPQLARERGVVEAEFIARIHDELARPATCGVGYNNIRFDDEVTRHTLYRNFFDPYAREWQNGNSRWDIIDMVRLTYALRPEGIEWPEREPGVPSFRLEDLTAANGIEHAGAHDALADVRATIALARLVRDRQPRLYDYVFTHRGKQAAAEMLRVGAWEPVLHVSAMYPSAQGCLAMVVPVAQDPVNRNAIIVYDLRHDPAVLEGLDAEGMRERLFTAGGEMPEGMQRLPMKAVHINKCPVLVPLNTLDGAAAARLHIDRAEHLRHLERLRRIDGLAATVAEAYRHDDFTPIDDPDLQLYSGGFFSDADRERMRRIRQMAPDALAGLEMRFDDPRIPEMLFRYRARNWPGTLSAQERQRWEAYRHRRLTDPDGGGSIVLDDYLRQIGSLLQDADLDAHGREILLALQQYGETILQD